jgi:hypothetical protein
MEGHQHGVAVEDGKASPMSVEFQRGQVVGWSAQAPVRTRAHEGV